MTYERSHKSLVVYSYLNKFQFNKRGSEVVIGGSCALIKSQTLGEIQIYSNNCDVGHVNNCQILNEF